LIQHGGADVIIIGRGGGSFEDLLAFSDESVVRAVAQCSIPIVSAVGHEIDISLCDMAADFRAPTPSAAAEIVSESREGLLGGLEYLASRLAAATRITTGAARLLLAKVDSRLTHPRYLLEQGKMRLDDLSFRLVSHTLARLTGSRSELKHLSGLLNSLGPQAVLDRGYAVVSRADGSIVRDPKQVTVGEGLEVRVAEGKIEVTVSDSDAGRRAKGAGRRKK
jgi:exodeoxyribonuclease VII large subunit